LRWRVVGALTKVVSDGVDALFADVDRRPLQWVSVDHRRRRVPDAPVEVAQLSEALWQRLQPVVAQPQDAEADDGADGVGKELQLVESQQERLELAQLRDAARQLEHLVVAEIQKSESGQVAYLTRKALEPAL